MRNLFFALVLVNLAFAAWTAWYAEPARPAGTPRETGVPIRLVGETGSSRAGAAGRADSMAKLPEADSPDPASGAASSEPGAATGRPAPPDAATSAQRCVSIGPFAESADVEAASAALESAGYVATERSAEGEIWVGFWVHIDAIPTRDEANAMLARLRENGLPDAYLIPGEEDGDIISLGVFNDMTRAGRLDAQVREIGLVPVIVERSRPGLVHWLDVEVPSSRVLDLDALGIRQDRLEQMPCEGAG